MYELVGNCVATVGDLGPSFEFTRENFELIGRPQNIEGKSRSSELSLVKTMTAEVEDWGFAVGDAVSAAETGGLSHCGFECFWLLLVSSFVEWNVFLGD